MKRFFWIVRRRPNGNVVTSVGPYATRMAASKVINEYVPDKWGLSIELGSRYKVGGKRKS